MHHMSKEQATMRHLVMIKDGGFSKGRVFTHIL